MMKKSLSYWLLALALAGCASGVKLDDVPVEDKSATSFVTPGQGVGAEPQKPPAGVTGVVVVHLLLVVQVGLDALLSRVVVVVVLVTETVAVAVLVAAVHVTAVEPAVMEAQQLIVQLGQTDKMVVV